MFFTELNTRTTKQLFSISTLLNPLQFNIFENDVFLSFSDNRYLKLRYDIPLSKQISNLFYSTDKSSYNIETEILYRGITENKSKMFINQSKKVIVPLFLKQGIKFPDYHITENVNSGEVVQYFDFSSHPLKPLILEFLLQFENNENWKLVEKSDIKNIYTVKTFNWKLNRFIKLSFENPNINFDRISQDHTDILNIFKENDSICPSIFNFVFYFNGNDENVEYNNYLLTKTDEQELNLDILDINKKYDLNLENHYNNIPDFEFENKDGITLKTENTLIGEIENRLYFVKDKNEKIYLSKFVNEKEISLKMDKINFKDFLGIANNTSLVKSANTIFSGPSYQNIKIEIKNQTTPIFRNGDYIAIKDIDENIEYRFIASENETCNCEKEFNKVCKIIGKTSIFKPSNVFWYSNNTDDLKSIKFQIKGIWGLYENSDIEVTYHTGLNNKITKNLKIFKLKHIKIENKDYTEFYLYDRDFNDEILHNIQKWEFQYKQPDIYYNFFNKFSNIKNIIEKIKKIVNEYWKNIIPLKVQINEKKDNEFLFVSKDIKTRNLKLIVNLSKLSAYKTIYINDIQFDPVKFNNYYNKDVFAYNETEFLKNAKVENDLIITFNKKDITELEEMGKVIINSPVGMFKLETYKMGIINSKNFSHTNNWVSGTFFDSEYAFILNNTFTNIENMFTNKLVKMVQEFKPQLIECKQFY